MGYRIVPHTADIRIEAWAPSREQCLAEAVQAMVSSFADPGGAAPDGALEVRIGPGPDEDLLVDTLGEVIYLTETTGAIPATVAVTADADILTVKLTTVGLSAAELVGAAPKAVSLHEIRFRPGPDGWSCAVTLDV